MSDDFYARLKSFSHFPELANPAHYTPVPADWHVLLTDVTDSTLAIEQGRYKEVNLVGAATIMAMLNCAGGFSIPYVFGGDGATLLIPAALTGPAHGAMSALCAKVRGTFGLNLRAAIVPVSALYEQGATLAVARFALSPAISQAMFQGNGLALAESWVKGPQGARWMCKAAATDAADITGLECRWQPIKNRNGVILSMLVKALRDPLRIYAEALREIEALYPDAMKTSLPVHASSMHFTLSPAAISREAKMRGEGPLYVLKTLASILVGKYALKTGKKFGTFDGAKYLSDLVANTDSRKYDEVLRMVLDSTQAQYEKLYALLERRREAGEIAYGIHTSQAALMTCLVFDYDKNHVHFVDGADGGYALAAREMKRQLKNSSNG